MVPSNIFTGEHVKQLEKYIATETEMQAFLNLPPTLFKNEKARKSILILQKKNRVKQSQLKYYWQIFLISKILHNFKDL